MTLGKHLLLGAGGSDPVTVEDVFSTYLYTGNGSSQTITNNIDLDGEGGMVWIKGRGIGYGSAIFDTERGATNYLISDSTNDEATEATSLSAFTSTGFDIADYFNVGQNNETYASWTFRKAKKFFDCVTYTGNDAGGDSTEQNIPHSLGVVPGMIIIKRTDTGGSATENWVVYHRSEGAQRQGFLNTTDAFLW